MVSAQFLCCEHARKENVIIEDTPMHRFKSYGKKQIAISSQLCASRFCQVIFIGRCPVRGAGSERTVLRLAQPEKQRALELYVISPVQQLQLHSAFAQRVRSERNARLRKSLTERASRLRWSHGLCANLRGSTSRSSYSRNPGQARGHVLVFFLGGNTCLGARFLFLVYVETNCSEHDKIC